MPFYGAGIHLDYGMGADEFSNNIYSYTGENKLKEEYKDKYNDP